MSAVDIVVLVFSSSGDRADGTVRTARVSSVSIGYKNILVNLDDALKVVRTYRSGDLEICIMRRRRKKVDS